jgi:hypothetical protein
MFYPRKWRVPFTVPTNQSSPIVRHADYIGARLTVFRNDVLAIF